MIRRLFRYLKLRYECFNSGVCFKHTEYAGGSYGCLSCYREKSKLKKLKEETKIKQERETFDKVVEKLNEYLHSQSK